MSSKIDISVIVPVFNEANNLEILHQRLTDQLRALAKNYEIVFVNDGSTDASLSIIERLSETDPAVFYIDLSRNFGHQIALSAGLQYCTGLSAVLIDSDLQDPPELIPALYKKYQEGYDVVYAKRKKRAGETVFKKSTAKLFYRLFKRLVAFEIPVDAGDFRLIDRKVIDALNRMKEQSKFLRGQISWLGFKQAYVEYDRDSRQSGKTGYSYKKMVHLAMNAITSFSDAPLVLVRKLGVYISLFSFLIILYAIFAHFVLKQTITGWTSLIISTMFLGGIQLFSIGIIGEYISRINKNVIDRPLYIVNKTNLKNVDE